LAQKSGLLLEWVQRSGRTSVPGLQLERVWVQKVGPFDGTGATEAAVQIGAPVGPLVGVGVTGDTTGAGVVGAKVGAEVGLSEGTGGTAA
jgi:hypothetical protein